MRRVTIVYFGAVIVLSVGIVAGWLAYAGNGDPIGMAFALLVAIIFEVIFWAGAAAVWAFYSTRRVGQMTESRE